MVPGLTRKQTIENPSKNTPYFAWLNNIEKSRFFAANKKEQIAIGKELPKLQAKNSQAGKASVTPETY